MANKPIITFERLRQALEYDHATGEFRWRTRPDRNAQWNGHFAGTVADATDRKGYIVIRLDGTLYKAHRLAWLYVTKEWPPDQIDHADRNPSNNRFDNLRLATGSQNQSNRTLQSNNTSGFKGVYWKKRDNKWRVAIGHNGNTIHLGTFDKDKIEEAAAAYAKAAARLHGEFARG